jgi:restriction system protein
LSVSLKSLIKGWAGEFQGTLAKSLFLDDRTYIDVNNVTIATSNGTTQIDHVIVSRFGVFVIEAKNMDGWIFGNGKSPQWTQNIFGMKFRFQNPLHQNYRHTKGLSEFFGVAHDKFFSIVMFWGECEFKTPMPPNVLEKGYVAYIKSHTAVLFSDQQVQEIAAMIRGGMLDHGWGTRRQHVAALKERFSSTTTCPKCGNALVLRAARVGANAGSQFYGCTKYPGCRYTAKAVE